MRRPDAAARRRTALAVARAAIATARSEHLPRLRDSIAARSMQAARMAAGELEAIFASAARDLVELGDDDDGLGAELDAVRGEAEPLLAEVPPAPALAMGPWALAHAPDVAAAGVAGAGGRLPHLDAIHDGGQGLLQEGGEGGRRSHGSRNALRGVGGGAVLRPAGARDRRDRAAARGEGAQRLRRLSRPGGGQPGSRHRGARAAPPGALGAGGVGAERTAPADLEGVVALQGADDARRGRPARRRGRDGAAKGTDLGRAGKGELRIRVDADLDAPAAPVRIASVGADLPDGGVHSLLGHGGAILDLGIPIVVTSAHFSLGRNEIGDLWITLDAPRRAGYDLAGRSLDPSRRYLFEKGTGRKDWRDDQDLERGLQAGARRVVEEEVGAQDLAAQQPQNEWGL